MGDIVCHHHILTCTQMDSINRIVSFTSWKNDINGAESTRKVSFYCQIFSLVFLKLDVCEYVNVVSIIYIDVRHKDYH